jgi:hypothetical protein
MEDLPTGFWMAHQGSGRYVENVDFYRFLYLQSMGPTT